MKSKLALLLATLLFFNIILPIQAHAAVIPDITQVTATWDPNIETGWDHVYLEYKSLDPQSRYEADKVIAANAYRFLISIGSKPLQGIDQQNFDDFLRAVSPFNIAYNNVLAEQVVHSAWVISGEQYKVFCANVIHNIASNPDYFNTHVIKNDPFVNGAGQQSLQVQYNDIDIDQSLNIYNNIFNGNVLTSSGGSVVGYYLNSLPSGYTGPNITYQDLSVYFNYYDNQYFNVYSKSYFNNSGSFIDSYLYLIASVNQGNYQSSLEYIDLSCYLYINNTANTPSASIAMSLNPHGDRTKLKRINLLNLQYPDVYEYTLSYDYSQSYSQVVDYNFALSISDYENFLKNFVNTYISNFDNIVFTPFFRTRLFVQVASEGIVFDKTVDLIPSSVLLSYVSPQFQPVNIYNNQYYGSDDDTYFHVDQMVDNIVNNDYSTVNNGSNNTFYNDNYYITQPVTGGGIELVTSSSIVYNYITIVNNGGGSSSGGSIGSYPYPFDVRIINPDDLKNETETNVTNEILNDNDVNFGDLNFSPSVTVGLNAAKDSIEGIVPVTGSSIVAQFVSGIPPDWLALGFVFLILFIAAGFGMSIIRH